MMSSYFGSIINDVIWVDSGYAQRHRIDISGIIDKFNIGIYHGAKDNFFCIFIGSDLHSCTKFPVIR